MVDWRKFNPGQARDPEGKWTLDGVGDVARTAAETIAEAVKARHPDVELHLAPSGNDLRISLIRTKDRGQGKARAAMQDLTDEADRAGVRLTLTPEPLAGDRKTSKTRLIAWYKSHGFVENKGRNKDYEVSDAMYRDPR